MYVENKVGILYNKMNGTIFRGGSGSSLLVANSLDNLLFINILTYEV